MSALPTRHDEAWRYADLDALAGVWPVAMPAAIPVTGEWSQSFLLDGAVDVRRIALDVAAGASARVDVLGAPSRYGRFEIEVTLGTGSHFELAGVQLAKQGVTTEIVSVVRHAEPGATSAQTVRCIAGAGGTVNFLGRVEVARCAQGTDASQSFRAMLLDRSGTANAKPELEIFADDVKCAHGAAVGELDQGALFYLAARGLSPAAARALLLEGMVGDLLADPTLDAQARALVRGMS